MRHNKTSLSYYKLSYSWADEDYRYGQSSLFSNGYMFSFSFGFREIWRWDDDVSSCWKRNYYYSKWKIK